jgi:prepilin-type N-terminal cleavage/methylation domain-containing protein
MKTHPVRRTLAFTLIELITVIAIISVLMALLFPHLAAARENARRQDASVTCKNIGNACNQYKNDYGKYPPLTSAKDGDPAKNGIMSFGDTEAAKCKVNNNILFDVLRAISRGDNQDHVMNPRQVKYFEQKKATDPKNPREGFCDGSEFVGEKQGRLMDPWGGQFCIVLDTDGDDIIDMSTFYTDLSDPANFVRFSAVAFSMGKDSKLGGKGYEGKLRKEKSNEPPDDIVSWQ